jgi:exosortase E/protease (VPEID-CTERM system)
LLNSLVDHHHRSTTPILRWGGLLALLAVEFLALSLRFSRLTLAGNWLWLQGLFESLFVGAQLLTAAATVALLFYGHRLGEALRRQDEPSRRPDRSLLCLLAHGLCLAIFVALTAAVLEGGKRPVLPSLALAIAWGGMALATLVSWIAIGLRPSSWMPLMRRGPGIALTLVATGLAAWGAGRLTGELWLPLNRSTLWLVNGILSLIFKVTVYKPDRFWIGTPKFSVYLAPQCSGFEGMGLIAVLITAFLWISRRRLRFPWAFALLPIAVGAIWVINAVRIAALVVVGTCVSGAVAMGGFHSQAGWLGFNVIGLGMIAVASQSPFVVDHGVRRTAARAHSGSSAYLAPLLTLVALGMVGAALTTGFDWFYPMRVLTAGGVLWHYRRGYNEVRGSVSVPAITVGIAAFVVWMVLEPMAPAISGTAGDPGVGLAALPKVWTIVWVVFRVVGSVVVVPLAEELAFRGYLTRRLIAADYQSLPVGTFSWPSFLISSALFGMLHGRWLAGMVTGLLYALALYRRRRLVDPILAHAITNALIAMTVLAAGHWSLWA